MKNKIQANTGNMTHEQHTQVILLARDLEEASKPRAPIYQ